MKLKAIKRLETAIDQSDKEYDRYRKSTKVYNLEPIILVNQITIMQTLIELLKK